LFFVLLLCVVRWLLQLAWQPLDAVLALYAAVATNHNSHDVPAANDFANGFAGGGGMCLRGSSMTLPQSLEQWPPTVTAAVWKALEVRAALAARRTSVPSEETTRVRVTACLNCCNIVICCVLCTCAVWKVLEVGAALMVQHMSMPSEETTRVRVTAGSESVILSFFVLCICAMCKSLEISALLAV
jgi:hypothetical protein